jgi:hypothetical protein
MKPISDRHPLTETDLDCALGSASDSILPSSGFAARVIAAVHTEADAPAPIPFPWKRAVPGFIAALAAIVLLFATLPSAVESAIVSARQTSIPLHSQIAATLLGHHGSAAWIAASLALSLGCLLFSRRLITGR